jgi:hypothetical protein
MTTPLLGRSRLRGLVGTLLLGATLAIQAGACALEAGSGYGYDDGYPPDAYIATTEPVYYEGRPTYYYGGRWYFRDGGHWAHYNREPTFLSQRRVQAPPARRNYEAWRGSPPRGPARGAGPGRGPAPARGGGWRGDHH